VPLPDKNFTRNSIFGYDKNIKLALLGAFVPTSEIVKQSSNFI
jgi:hypothetical protein